MYLFKFISLYHLSKALFIHPFYPYHKQFKKGNSLVVLFRSTSEQNYYVKLRDFNLESIPFQIYYNLIVSCFKNFKTCKRVLKLKYYFNINEYDNDTYGLQQDGISHLFMDSLINNNLIYQIFKILPNLKLNWKIKIYALKCLLMLLTRKLAIPIISVMQRDFINKFTQSLIMIINCGNLNHEIQIFLIYSISLIYKLNHYINFKSFNNLSFTTSTNDKNLLKNGKNKL
ncbi:hypothetical protein MXB_4017 [Myxobolus squamalis]|nr:hypothetical protein MXB_4017 [Myxobolus squamalis]